MFSVDEVTNSTLIEYLHGMASDLIIRPEHLVQMCAVPLVMKYMIYTMFNEMLH